jgi:hypothetical protein
MAKRAKGFIPPEHADIPEDVCMLVFVPNDPHAIAAFWGQFEDLGLWTTWARTGDSRARDIALRYKQSINESLDLHDEVGCMSPLTINVNCGSQTNCSQLIQFDLDLAIHIGAEDLADIVALPGGNIDNGYLPPTQETYSEYLTLKCAYANQMATDIYNSWDNLASLGLSAGAIGLQAFGVMLSTGSFVSALTGLVGGIVTSGTLGTVALGAFVGLGALFGIAAYGYFEQLQAAMSINDLRCALYGATSAEDARKRVADTFYEFGVSAGLVPIAQGELVDAFVYVAKTLTPVTILEPLFDATPYTLALPVADCTLCSGVEPPPVATLQNGLVHYWEMEEANTTRVSSHSGRTWNEVGTVPAVLDGITGSAASFNATQNILRLAAATQLYSSGSSWTLAFWVRPKALPGSFALLLGWGDDEDWGSQSFILQLNNDGSIGLVTPGNLESDPVALDAWHLVVVTYDGPMKEVTLSVDNAAPSSTILGAHPLANSAQAVSLACLRDSNPAGWAYRANVDIDEFGQWDRPLTEDEATEIWNVGFGLSYENIVNPGGGA